MARSVLLVHDSRSVRMLLRRQLLAEATDLVVQDVATTLECERHVTAEKVALVAAGVGADWKDALAVLQMLSALPQPPAFLLVLAEDLPTSAMDEFHAAGLKHSVRVPCKAETLLAAVNEACNPRSLRSAPRTSIPGTVAAIQFGDGTTSIRLAETRVVATVVNISTNGILLDMEMPKDAHAEAWRLFETLPLRVEFPDGQGAVELQGRVARLDVLSDRTDRTPLVLRAALKFLRPPTSALQQLEGIFAAAGGAAA